MVKRYVCIEGFNLDDVDGDWIRYDDYAALEARMTSIISGVQLELEDERKVRMKSEARVAELERDAARYRKMRDLTSWTVGSYGTGVVLTVHCPRVSFMQLLGPECEFGKAIDSLEESK